MSFSLHSSTVNLGGGRRSGSLASNSSSRRSWPVKSSMGLMSLNVSARWTSRNFLKESRWTAMRSGSGRTSSRLAKVNRSRATERAGKGLLLRKTNRAARPLMAVRDTQDVQRRRQRGSPVGAGNVSAGPGRPGANQCEGADPPRRQKPSGGTRGPPGRAAAASRRTSTRNGRARQRASVRNQGRESNPPRAST